MAHSSLRFGIGRFTTEAEIDYVIREIVRTVTKLRDMRCAAVVGTRYSPSLTESFQSSMGDGSGGY